MEDILSVAVFWEPTLEHYTRYIKYVFHLKSHGSPTNYIQTHFTDEGTDGQWCAVSFPRSHNSIIVDLRLERTPVLP